jgi:6-pyruvoyltetrahydropterin/6-carboxytetrahydropterin synthase
MEISITKKYEFSAAHRLHSPFLNESENVDVYDKCNNINGHGHDYKIWVTVRGEPHIKTGMIIAVEKLDAILEEVLKTIDYKHLDNEVEFFKKEISTAENIIRFIWINLVNKFEQAELIHLKLWETNNNYFELGREL